MEILSAEQVKLSWKGEFFEQAGELYERVQEDERALDCYKKAGTYARAVELARHAFPDEVVKLKDEWGDHLSENKAT